MSITAPQFRNDTYAMILSNEMKRIVWGVMYTLTEREMDVVYCRVVDRMTLAAIGKNIGVGRERIRQIEAKAFRKLHHAARMKWLKEVA